MRQRLRLTLTLLIVACAASEVFPASGPSEATGEVGLALMIRKLATVGTVMHAVAHPDDENNGLLAMQSHGQGLRTVVATATRGNGGQNEIGPELFEALGVLRTEELLAAHRFDGGEQFFGLAVDFGFSFSIEETYDLWNKDATVGDYVRLMRMTRPDVVLTMRPDGQGGGQHHQASARLAVDAFHAAGDPARYPEQIAAGLHPWRPRKIYQVGYYGFPGEPEPAPGAKLVPVDFTGYDPLLGRTYLEIGAEGRAMHKCQGMAQLLPLPGSASVKYKLVDTSLPGGVDRDETTLTDGLDLSLTGLAGFAGATPPAPLVKGLGEISAAVTGADRSLREQGPDAAVADLARGLIATRGLLAFVTSGDATLASSDAAFEIAFRLRQTERKFEQALVLAQGLRLEALADDGVVVPGESAKLTLILANRGKRPVRVGSIGALSGFVEDRLACTASPVASPGQIVRCEGAVTIPQDARVSEPYWHRADEAGRYTIDADAPFGLPFRPTPFTATFSVDFDGAEVRATLPVQYRYEGNIFSGEKRMELQVVPRVTLRTTPAIAILPRPSRRPVPTRTASISTPRRSAPADGSPAISTPDASRAIQVIVTNNSPGPLETDVRVEAPDGWTVTPVSRHVAFARADEAATIGFNVAPPAVVPLGSFTLRAVAQSGGQAFDRGYQVIEYPHIHRRHVFEPSTTELEVIDVAVPRDLMVGYVMGVGDQVPSAIEQIGASVVLLDEAALASGDLSRYDAIVTGVRAYERRRDLRAYNHRLLEYAAAGGTLVVQYNKFEFNQAQYAPFPAKVSANRVTDEHAPVTVLVPDHPVFTEPNRIDDRAWDHWVQERGLYFLGARDPKYVDLVELADPFPFNPGQKRGALVEARVDRGRWIYVGLGLWRQLPAGTEGAYRLLANILSLGRTEPASARK